MNNRLHQLLLGLLVVQLILAVVIFIPKGAPAGVAAPLLEGIKAEDVTTLAIRDDQGNSVKLAKHSNAWVLADADDYPADAAKITPVLDKLLAAKTGRLVTQTEGSHARLQVADTTFVRRVEIGAASGTSRVLFLGTGGGGSSSHVRLSGRNEVYLVGDLATWEINADAAAWIDTSYLDVAQADVTGLALSNANGQVSLLRDAAGAWTLQDLAAGETVNANNITSLLGQVSTLRMTRPLGKTDQPAYGLTKPNAVLTLKAKKDGQDKVYTLTVGARDATDNSYVVKSSESPYYVRVAEYSVKDLVEKRRDGFLQLPPTPAPTPKP
jgi:hypothetical protein